MKKQNITGNYTPIDNTHITLAFFGEYPNPEERWTLTLEEAVNYFYTKKKKTNIIISNVPIPEPETLKNNIRKAADYIRSIIGR